MDAQSIPLREYLNEKFEAIDKKADAIIALQQATNGRVRAAEKAIAVLTWAYGLGAAVLAWIVIETVKH